MKKNVHIGLRTIKTALSVTLAIILVRLYTENPDSVYYAAMGATVGMDITVTRSLRQGLTQLISVFCGTLFGYLSLFFFPATPAWIVGIGILILIIVCNLLKISYSITLSCIIFLSAALTASREDNLVMDALLRMRNTSVGVCIALIVNAAIRPYNNKKRIVSMLHSLQEMITDALVTIVVREQYPSIDPIVDQLRSIDSQLSLYHAQRLFHRKHDDEAMLRGCRQLCSRMLQELEAICGMDSLGNIAMETAAKMQELGMELPEAGIAERKCTRHDTIVMNYHLEKLLTAHQFLDELIGQL